MAGGGLLLLYVATTAPDVTWWDAGEFIAAVHTVGIPHPPGTPLYILLARAWSTLLVGVDRALAVNLLSAVCTALAGAVIAALITRVTGRALWGVAAALCGGTMTTVWLSATEAEVYAASLLLSAAMLLVAERTGRAGDRRGVVLLAYLFGLATPLHATALIAGPAAIWLAVDGGRGPRWWWLAGLGTIFIAAAGLATGRWMIGVGALLAAGAVAVASTRYTSDNRVPLMLPIVVIIGASAVAFLLARAPHDPAINQGNPATLSAMMGMVARDQFDIAGLWPRQAPLWMQIGNFLQYADWQAALGLAPRVTPAIPRTIATMGFIILGVHGSLVHRERDLRSWRALAVLGLSASLGVILYLNLKAGPSIGYGILPDDAPHEPRERDYFFALAFWTWGVWAGIGAIELAQRHLRLRRHAAVGAGLALAGLPALLNWRAVDRRAEPEASLPARFASELLEAAPPRAILLVAGDNDTYPLWYAQEVRGIRRDVVTVTYPLIGADWYRAELYRRWRLGHPPPYDRWRGMAGELAAIGVSARTQGRPVAVAVTVDRGARERLGRDWRLTGLVYVERRDPTTGVAPPVATTMIDDAEVGAAAARLAPLLAVPLRPSIDPTSRFMRQSFECPSLAARSATDTVAVRRLESVCNY